MAFFNEISSVLLQLPIVLTYCSIVISGVQLPNSADWIQHTVFYTISTINMNLSLNHY